MKPAHEEQWTSPVGRRRRFGRRNSSGRYALYRFAPPDRARPVVVLTRDSARQYLSTATVAPITSSIRGVPSEVRLDEEDGMKGPCAVNPLRMREICGALLFSSAATPNDRRSRTASARVLCSVKPCRLSG